MQELIDMIRVATTPDATQEQKAAGVQACRTIVAALDCEPGKPLTLAPQTQTTSGISIDQVLEMMIARLSVMAKESDDGNAIAAPLSTAPAPTRVVPLRVPMATTSMLKAPVQPRNAAARSVPTRSTLTTLRRSTPG